MRLSLIKEIVFENKLSSSIKRFLSLTLKIMEKMFDNFSFLHHQSVLENFFETM